MDIYSRLTVFGMWILPFSLSLLYVPPVWPRVRLACQVRPERDLNVKVLLSAGNGGTMQELDDDALKIGNQRDVAVLVTDIRGFSTLARTQLPQDLVVLLNRVIDDMKQAVSARGGSTAIRAH